MLNLYKKLLSIQKDIKPIIKDETNPHFQHKYFDINSVVADLRPIFNAHDVIVLQPLVEQGGLPAIKTILIEPESGETMEFITPMIANSDPQKFGGICTYFRRYALTSLFLLQGEVDDDANSAAGKPVTYAPKPASAPAPVPSAVKLDNWETFVMPFGKHKGEAMVNVPSAYIMWLQGTEIKHAGLAEAVRMWQQVPKEQEEEVDLDEGAGEPNNDEIKLEDIPF